MSLKHFALAGAAALTLAFATVPVVEAGPNAGRDKVQTDRMTVKGEITKSQARKLLANYFQKRGQYGRVYRSWVSKGYLYAKVVTRANRPMGTYKVSLKTGRVARLKR